MDETRPDVPPERLHIWQIQAVRDLLMVAVVVSLVWLGYAMRAVTVPLLVALLLAYLFEPLVARLSRHRKLSRPMVVGGLLATVGVVFVAVLAIAVPTIVTQTAELVREYQQGQFREKAVELVGYLPEAWQEQANGLIRYLPAAPDAPLVAPGEPAAPGPTSPADGAGPAAQPAGPVEAERIRTIVREEIARAGGVPDDGAGTPGQTRSWLGVARGGARAATAVLGGILQLGFLAFLIPFYFFFFSVWYPSVARFAASLVPDANRERTNELALRMDRVVAGFVRGRIIISLIMGVMLAIGWSIFGVPYSIVLGLVVGLFCAVPYLGGVGIPVAVALLAFKELGEPAGEAMAWWGVILWPTAVFAVVQVIEGYVLTPVIAGKVTNLDPVTILVAVLAGGSILGVYGMLLAIPVAACLKIFLTDVLLPKVRAWTKGEAADPLPIDRE
jgi:predicted PurR-regulated permease PerM